MIMGECLYCNEPFMLVIPDVPLPKFIKYDCEHCGKWFWEKLSRVDPMGFLPEEVEVDEKTKQVKIKEESDEIKNR